MTAKEVLTCFSETLLQDERILSLRERELLTKLLQRAREKSVISSDGYSAASSAIIDAVGETVGQRAFSVLGSEIVQCLLEEYGPATEHNIGVPLTVRGPRPPQPTTGSGPRPPQPTASGPRPPQPTIASGPRPPQPTTASGPRPPQPTASGPRPPQPTIASGPRPPQPTTASGPRPPQPTTFASQHETAVSVIERPEFLPAQFVVLDEFLVPEELNSIIEYTRSREGDFQLSEVIAPGQTGATLDYEHRRSRVLMDIGEHQAVVLNRIQAYLPRVLQKMGREVFPVTRVEAQITASNDGDFFRNHNDNGQDEIASRELTFVYFFHREPKAFQGGELRIYDSKWENGEYVSTGNYQTIVPEQNQVVFFPSSLLHEITPVECPSLAFADSRFTVNGWFHR